MLEVYHKIMDEAYLVFQEVLNMQHSKKHMQIPMSYPSSMQILHHEKFKFDDKCNLVPF